MKKNIALLIAIMCVTFCMKANADSRYMEIKTELTDEEVLGDPSYVDNDEITSFVLAFDYTDNTVMLLGFDENDECESLMWNGNEPETMDSTMHHYCSNFSEYEGGDRDFKVAYKLEGHESYTLIDSPEEASIAASVIEEKSNN